MLFVAGFAIPGPARAAEEPAAIRPYMHWRVGEFAPAWGVLDLRGISFGAQLNRHASLELALDAWQLDLESGTRRLGEQQIISLFPQALLGVPAWNGRLFFYAVGGIGGTWIQFNDRKNAGIGQTIHADGITFAATVGMGMDLFLARNLAFNVESRYVWSEPLGIRVGDQRRDWDPSSFLATIGLRVFFDRDRREQLLRRENDSPPLRVYFGTQGGFTALTDGNWVSGARIVPKLNAIGDTFNLNYTLALGADYGRHLGLEIAMAHTEYSLRLANIGAVTEYSSYTAIPMLRVRFPSDSGRWTHYLLAGAGIIYSEANDSKPLGADLEIKAMGISPAFAVGGGTEYFLARNLSLNCEARWRYAWDQGLRVTGGPSGRGDHAELQFTIGFRAYLWESGRARRSENL